MAANERTPPDLRSLRSRAAMAARWGWPNAEALQSQARAGFLRIRIETDLAKGLLADDRRQLAALLLDANGGEQA